MQGHFQDAERFLFGESLIDSFPIKTLDSRARRLVPASSRVENFMPRLATALLVAARASSVDFASGSLVPRAFGLAGSDWVIENGCGQDIVHCGAAGLISVGEPAEDRFVLSAVFVHSMFQNIGESRLIEFMQQPAPQRLAGL
jgi:hypothetical protein